MISAGTQHSENARETGQTAGRSPLGQLLHALNQPLTGLQCSMEVALARARTPEQYVEGLRQGLELTERMRVLVGAIREVTDAGIEGKEELETIDLTGLLREVVEELAPVAEVKSVCLTLDCAASAALTVKAGRRRMVNVVFRLVESALGLAVRGSAVRIEAGGESGAAWIRVRWQGGAPSLLLQPELGLLVAQAGWERTGAEWERERVEDRETVTVRLPGVSSGNRNIG